MRAGAGGADPRALRPLALDADRAGAAGEAGEIRAVREAARTDRAAPVALADDDEFSLPGLAAERDPVLLMLGHVLGARLSTDNLAWRGDPVPLMRSLQKMLVAHSLTLAAEARAPALEAIRAVELAVRWRLRWLQMRRSEAERHFIEPQQERHATQKSA